MKKVAWFAVAVVAALVLTSAASARMWDDDDYGPGYGRGFGMMYGAGTGTNVNIDKFKQFQKETSGLREEMMLKRVELQNEYAKEKPDTDRVATLKKELIDLRTKIHKAAEKAGIEGAGRGMMGGRHGRGMMSGGPGGCGGCGGGCGW